MDKARAMRRLWATVHDLWETEVADYIIHAFTIARFGKESCKELTEQELATTLDWLEKVGDR